MQNTTIDNVADAKRMLPERPEKNLNRLWLALSGHGHGHLAQVSPLIQALRERFPSLVLSVQSGLPANLLRQSFGNDIEICGEAADFGMVMSGPLTVLPEASLVEYQRFHESWDERLARQVDLYQNFRPDLVIGDIPYLPLAAARTCGLISVAVCSLNWADILEHYCSHLEGAHDIVSTIRTHYASADLFLRPTPAMPMESLANTVSIGPLISVGVSRRMELDRLLQLPEGKRLVLLTLGGIAGQVDISHWPRFDDTVFLVPASWLASLSTTMESSRFHSIESTNMAFGDLFASCDAMVTKPGYGAFTGAGCSGLPVLFTERGDWPEEPYLRTWLSKVGRAASISGTELAEGEFAQALDELIKQPWKAPADASGAAEGVALIEALFCQAIHS